MYSQKGLENNAFRTWEMIQPGFLMKAYEAYINCLLACLVVMAWLCVGSFLLYETWRTRWQGYKPETTHQEDLR